MIELLEVMQGENKRPAMIYKVNDGVCAVQALIGLFKNVPEEMIEKLKAELWQKR